RNLNFSGRAEPSQAISTAVGPPETSSRTVAWRPAGHLSTWAILCADGPAQPPHRTAALGVSRISHKARPTLTPRLGPAGATSGRSAARWLDGDDDGAGGPARHLAHSDVPQRSGPTLTHGPRPGRRGARP